MLTDKEKTFINEFLVSSGGRSILKKDKLTTKLIGHQIGGTIRSLQRRNYLVKLDENYLKLIKDSITNEGYTEEENRLLPLELKRTDKQTMSKTNISTLINSLYD